MSIIVGPRVGARVGPVVGHASAGNGVPRDVSVYWPESTAHWTALGVSSTPDFAVNCNGVTSGNLVDYISGFTFIANGSPQYNQTATGHTRTGVGFTDNMTARFTLAAGTGPDPATTSSFLVIRFYLRSEAAAARQFGGMARCNQSSDQVRIGVSPSAGTNRLNIQCDGGNAVAVADHAVGFHYASQKFDRANSVCAGFSELVKGTTAYSGAVLDGEKGIGGNAVADMVVLDFFGWIGARAEAITNAIHKADMALLGHSSAWTP